MKNVIRINKLKQLISFIFLISLSTCIYSQSNTDKTDSCVIKAINRSLDLDMFEHNSGALILRVYKKDSGVNVSLLYKSYKKFPDSDYNYLKKAINKSWNFSKTPPFDLVVPIYIIPVDECCIKEKEKEEVSKELEDLRRKGYKVYESIVELRIFETLK